MSEYTLEDIAASWLGHGKQIPIGQMMAWLIKEVRQRDAIDMEEAQRRIEERFWLRLKEAETQVENLEQETHDQAEQIETLTRACQDMTEPAKNWWQVYQDRCEGAWVEATIVKELKRDIAKLKESAENWKATDREKFDEIAKLKDQISMYVKNGAEAVHELEQENAELKQKLTEAREINQFYGNTKSFWPCSVCGAMNEVERK